MSREVSDKTWDEVVAELWPEKTINEQLFEISVMSKQCLRAFCNSEKEYKERLAKIEAGEPVKVICTTPATDTPNRNHDVITKEAWAKAARKAKVLRLESAAYALLDNISDSLYYLDQVKTNAAKVVAALDLASDETATKLLPPGSWNELLKAATALRLTEPKTGWTVHSLLTALQNVTVSENDNGTETCSDAG